MKQITSGYLIPILAVVGVAIIVLSENLILQLPETYLQLTNIALIAYLIYEANLPSLVLGPDARKFWSIPFVVTAAFTYGIFIMNTPSDFIQYSGMPIVTLFLITILIIYRTRNSKLLTGEIKAQYETGLAAHSTQNPDFAYTSVEWMRSKINARDALLLFVILKLSSPLFIGTFVFAGIMVGIEKLVPFNSTVEIILLTMLALVKMNNHLMNRTPFQLDSFKPISRYGSEGTEHAG